MISRRGFITGLLASVAAPQVLALPQAEVPDTISGRWSSSPNWQTLEPGTYTTTVESAEMGNDGILRMVMKIIEREHKEIEHFVHWNLNSTPDTFSFNRQINDSLYQQNLIHDELDLTADGEAIWHTWTPEPKI